MDAALSVRNLRAYYVTDYFGIKREVRAVDDITLSVKKNEIYGIAGKSSCGKSSFIKTIAAAVRPPLRVLGGSIKYSFLDRDIYELDERASRQDALEASLLHPSRLDERSQSRPPRSRIV